MTSFSINIKKVKGAVLSPYTSQQGYVIVIESEDKDCYSYISHNHLTKLQDAKIFVNEDKANLFLKELPTTVRNRAIVVPLTQLTKTVYRYDNYGKLLKSIAPLNNNGPDWKATEVEARRAAIKKLKKKILNKKEKFEAELRTYYTQLNRLETTSLRFIKEICDTKP